MIKVSKGPAFARSLAEIDQIQPGAGASGDRQAEAKPKRNNCLPSGSGDRCYSGDNPANGWSIAYASSWHTSKTSGIPLRRRESARHLRGGLRRPGGECPVADRHQQSRSNSSAATTGTMTRRIDQSRFELRADEIASRRSPYHTDPADPSRHDRTAPDTNDARSGTGRASAGTDTLEAAGNRRQAWTRPGCPRATGDERKRLDSRPGNEGGARGHELLRETAILDALPANIALIDADGVIVGVNKSWRCFADDNDLQIPGYGVGLNYLDLCLHGGVDDEVADGIRSVLKGVQDQFGIEYPCNSPTQSRWFQMTVAPFGGESPEGAVIMHSDISERKSAQHTAVELADRLTTTLRSITDAILVMDTDWRFTFVNPEAERLVARSADELLGQRIWSAFPEVIGSRFEHAYRRAVMESTTVSLEEYFPPLQKWFSVRAFPSEQGLTIYFRDSTESRRAAESLRASELEFRTLADAMPQMVWVAQPDHGCVYANQQWLSHTGQDLDQCLGQDWMTILHPDDLAGAQNAWRNATAERSTCSIECRLRSADGSYRWWLVRAVPLQDDQGTILKWFGTCTDIHNLKLAELKLSHANQDLRQSEVRVKRLNRVYAVLSQINALIVRASNRDELFHEACRVAVELGGLRFAALGIVDKSGRRIAPVACAGLQSILESAPPEVFENTDEKSTRVWQAIKTRSAQLTNDLGQDDVSVMKQPLLKLGINSYAVIPLVVRHEAIGVLILCSHEIGFFDDEEMRLLQELIGNIALAIEHLDKQDRLDYLAYYDDLTGLANRTLFLERVAQHIRGARTRGRKIAVFLIDLERFKNINDTLGWRAGDALLKQVADRLSYRGGDASLFARIGSDRFAAVLPDVRRNGNLTRLLEKSMEDLRSYPFELDAAVLRLAVKVGVATFPNDGDDAETLFQHAEAALKQAKITGDRYLLYSPSMTASIAGNLTLENQLRRALENQEFVLHYQPKVDLKTGEVTGAEALIRWNDPQTCLVPPARFIPILEQTGLIHEVGRWALQQAIDDYLRWRNKGLHGVRIAVNVSPMQLRDRSFIADLERLLAVDVRAAGGLQLEITESMIMADIKHGIASLQAIRAMGVSVALDDFGTGFSSLSYLTRLPIDTLKIDRSFVADITTMHEGLAIVSAIINLSHSLKHKVVAEGVETEEQRRLLRLLGCDQMQGFHFSKPVPTDVFEAEYLHPNPPPLRLQSPEH